LRCHVAKVDKHIVDVLTGFTIASLRLLLQEAQLFEKAAQISKAFLQNTLKEVALGFPLGAEVDDDADNSQRQQLGVLFAFEELETRVGVCLTSSFRATAHELLTQVIRQADTAEFLQDSEQDVLRDVFEAFAKIVGRVGELWGHPVESDQSVEVHHLLADLFLLLGLLGPIVLFSFLGDSSNEAA